MCLPYRLSSGLRDVGPNSTWADKTQDLSVRRLLTALLLLALGVDEAGVVRDYAVSENELKASTAPCLLTALLEAENQRRPLSEVPVRPCAGVLPS